MIKELNLFFQKWEEKDRNTFFKEVFQLENEKAIFHIQNNKIYIYTYHQMCIYIFDSKKERTETKEHIQTVYINPKLSYQKYCKNNYNNITLLAALLFSKSPEEQTDILSKMTISNFEKILTIIKQKK